MQIVTDSAAELSTKEVESLGITVTPLQIQFPEGSISSEAISHDEFYNRLEAMAPQIPTTSQPSSGMFASLYRKLNEIREDILSIHISSGLSGTLESARLGASQVDGANISLVDSLTLSGGQRFQVLAAALAARTKWNKKAILERLRLIRENTEVVFTLETLSYLAHGGRIGRVQALAGSLLKIKPIITVDKVDGKYNTIGKERTLGRAMESMREHLVHVYGDTPLRIAIMHGRFSEQARILAQLLAAGMKVQKLEVLRVSPVLGVHTGPGVVGAAVVPAVLMEDLG